MLLFHGDVFTSRHCRESVKASWQHLHPVEEEGGAGPLEEGSAGDDVIATVAVIFVVVVVVVDGFQCCPCGLHYYRLTP